MSLLMNRLCIERLVGQTSFSTSLLIRLREEESNCKEVHRLAAIVDVCLGLVGTGNGCQKVCSNAIESVLSIVFLSKLNPLLRPTCRSCWRLYASY